MNFYRLVDRLNDFNLFVIASFTIRIIEALGAAAYSVAAYVLVVDLFPNNLGAVRVSSLIFLVGNM